MFEFKYKFLCLVIWWVDIRGCSFLGIFIFGGGGIGEKWYIESFFNCCWYWDLKLLLVCIIFRKLVLWGCLLMFYGEVIILYNMII